MIDDLLAVREVTHGKFKDMATIAAQLIRLTSPNVTEPHHMAVGRYQICFKLARIAAGNASHADHWDDIAGYARLVSRALKSEISPVEP